MVNATRSLDDCRYLFINTPPVAQLHAQQFFTAYCLLPAIPVDFHVMGCAAAGDDIREAVAIQVGGEGVFAGHAAIVDGVPLEGERLSSRAWDRKRRRQVLVGTGTPGLLGSALTDDQLVVVVAVEVGRPDGVAPLQWLGDRGRDQRPASQDGEGRSRSLV